MALEFARAGAAVVLTDRDGDALPEAADEVAAAGGQAAVWTLDVTDVPRIRQVREELLAHGGPLDVLVNNAGVVFGGAFLDVPLEEHLRTYRVNTEAVAAVAHVFLPDLVARPEAHLVNIASASGFIGLPFGSTYASSKWAVIGLSESLRLELRELGHRHVGVTTVCPSYIDTGMFHGVGVPRGTRMLRPQRLAQKVLRAVERNRPFVITPAMANLAPALRGVLPLALLDAVGSVFGASTSMRSWRGHKN